MKGKLTRKIRGTKKRPRLAVFRSSKHIYAQVIDDDKGITMASASNLTEKGGNNIAAARRVGEKIAKLCVAAGIKKVAFDRCGYLYHGRVAALADAARAGGLDF